MCTAILSLLPKYCYRTISSQITVLLAQEHMSEVGSGLSQSFLLAALLTGK